MKFRPLQDRVLIRRLDSEEKTAGGIIIPDTAKAVSYTHLDVYKRQADQDAVLQWPEFHGKSLLGWQ